MQLYAASSVAAAIIPIHRSWNTPKSTQHRPPHMSADAIDAVVADMRILRPQLCRSISASFKLEEIFIPEMLVGCDLQFLRLVATTIAMQNLHIQVKQAQAFQESQIKVINQQAITICNLSAELSWYTPDQLHWEREEWGFGHAETRGPELRYNGCQKIVPSPPLTQSKLSYIERSGEIRGPVIISLPSTT